MPAITGIVAVLCSTALSMPSTFEHWVDEPRDGWRFEYESSSGFRPDEAVIGVSRMKSSCYERGEMKNRAWTSIVSDGGGCVLFLANRGENTEDGDYDWAHFSSVETRMINVEKLTLDIEFKIMPSQATSPKFSISASLPSLRNSRESECCWLAFSDDRIHYISGGDIASLKSVSFLNWHKARIHVDLAEGRYRLYLDGAPSPLFAAALRMSQDRMFKVQFGDGSKDVKGDAEVRCFRWTDRELVSVADPSQAIKACHEAKWAITNSLNGRAEKR